MGSWNKTCALSTLPIVAGTEVLVFPLIKNHLGQQHYTSSMWYPVLFPFISYYNDYGGGEKSRGINLNLVLGKISSILLEQVNNKKPIDSPNNLDENSFFNAVQKRRLFVHSVNNTVREVSFAMIRSDVVNHILQNWKWELYVGIGGNTGYNNRYLSVTFNSIIEQIPDLCSRYKAKWIADDFTTLQSLYDRHEYNCTISLLLHRSHHSSVDYVCNIDEVFVELYEQGKINEAVTILHQHLKGKYIDLFMDQTRKMWSPGGFEGSQNSDCAPYKVLANAILEVCERENNDEHEYE